MRSIPGTLKNASGRPSRPGLATDQVVDGPASLASFAQESFAQEPVESITAAQVGVLAGAANVEHKHVVAACGQLDGQMVIRNRPECGIQSQTMAENHGQLASVRVCGPIMAHA
jgi:hypothetical protein